jgi:CheY-like chemotaxis protein
MMPEMDGIETVRRIRSPDENYPYLQEVPIVALTANTLFGSEEQLLANGFNDFLSKPIDPNSLHNILDRWISKEKRTNSDNQPEMSKQETDADFEIEGLNTKQGIMLSGGTVENYLKTLVVFQKDGHDKIKNIRMCQKTNNLPLYVIHVHALVSASANVGAEILSDTAKALETAGKREDMVFIQTNGERFLADLETLLVNIKSALAKMEKGERRSSMSIESLKIELTLLRTAVIAFDSATIKNVTDGLQKTHPSAEVAPVIAGILHNILIGDFDKTLTLIDSLLTTL